MINYELAKELKDAGFPMNKKCLCKEEICIHISYPTLSELIEACGGNLGKLVQEVKGEWYCYDKSRISCLKGSTPEEAVSRLWLNLNKK